MRRMRGFFGLLGVCSLAACGNMSASQSLTPPQSQAMQVGHTTSAPFGYIDFCTRFQDDCQAAEGQTQPTALTRHTWTDLLNINASVNAAILPVTDADHYRRAEFWTYPISRGDCEDYALAKRKALIEKGWAAQNLLLTVAIERSGSAHAVLIVTTDKGDFVLDNQIAEIMPWQQTPYTWAKRQSQADPNVWVTLETDRPTVQTATSVVRASY